MYPTVVIVLVETQRSILRSMPDIYEISLSNATKLAASEARPATPGHLSFAVGSVHSTTDNETEF